MNKISEIPSIRGRHFLLTVPHFETSLDGVIEALKTHQPEGEYLRYAAVIETHTLDENKSQHLHLYLCYPKLIRLKLDRFDYLGKHGKLQRVRDYSSVLKYMTKEARPRANFDYIEPIMKKDFAYACRILMDQGWKPRQIIKQFQCVAHRRSWQSYLKLIAFNQQTQKFMTQASKPGLRFITPELIKARLTPEEYVLYNSVPEYALIVDYINDIVRYGTTRPHKAKALFLVGSPGIGKTTLGLALQARVGTFTFPDDGWWQGYQSEVFKLIIWNEFNLKRMSYPTLLKFLQGLRMDLPIKGSHVNRSDNPLILLTSNLSLEQHICKRFSSEQDRTLSRANLNARICQVNLGKTQCFLLLKLLVSPCEDI